jgi:hypothetical protein
LASGCCSSAWLNVKACAGAAAVLGPAGDAGSVAASADDSAAAAAAALAAGAAAGAGGAAGPIGLLLLGTDSIEGGMEVRPARGEGTSKVEEETMAAICVGEKKAKGRNRKH